MFWNRKKAISKASEKVPLVLNGHTANSFRELPELCANWQLLMSEPTAKHVLSVMYNSIPRGYPARGQLVNDTTAAIELGRNQGFLDALSLLQLLTQPVTKQEQIDQDYGATNITSERGYYPND